MDGDWERGRQLRVHKVGRTPTWAGFKSGRQMLREVNYLVQATK
jgi:ribosomal protein L30/L7E